MFGLYQITSASPMRGRHYDAVFRSQVLGPEAYLYVGRRQ